jgi:hypothetical protein
MNREEIIKLAQEAGMQLAWIATAPGPNKMKVLYDFDGVQRFAALVAAAEREACAKVCEAADKSTHPADLADAIRARGQA